MQWFLFLIAACAAVSTAVGFSIPGTAAPVSSLLSATTTSSELSIDDKQQNLVGRDIQALDSWAAQNDILQKNGFELLDQYNTGDWSVHLSQSATQAHRVLQVPSPVILSSTRIRQELEIEDNVNVDPAVELLEIKKCQHQIPQFFLLIKILQEYEKGADSAWYPWMQSLPKTFDTAVCMDTVELECLPPFAWSLAQLERIHFDVFVDALKLMTNAIVTPETTLQDDNLLRWAFNVVFTRCWGQDGDDSRCDIVPMGDMFNHGEPANVCILYDEDDHCNIIFKYDVEAGTPLRLSYGKSTNPSRFLAIFGFVDESQPVIFCQVLVNDPSDRHVEMGYDTSKMVFSTDNGTIADEVWNVVLFSILEQVPSVQKALYQAHINGDDNTKNAIRQQFFLETGIVLKKHVDGTLKELQALLEKIDGLDSAEHSRLPMIQKHNVFVHRTFSKVKLRLDGMVKAEMERRKALAQ